MGSFPSVAVLMSTYNGERYLDEQIASVFGQQGVEIQLFVRDDGSQDCTLQILEKYGDSIYLIKGNNVGVGNSFYSVLLEAGTSFDYYAFCDQDDIWLPSKLNRAIDAISHTEYPVCYCSNQTLCDKDGKITGNRYSNPVETNYLKILNNNNVTGCTMVWNKRLQKLLTDSSRLPSRELLIVRIHDVWVAMVASVVGGIHYDFGSYIYYRQHEHNVVGVKKKPLISQWKLKIGNKSIRNGRSKLAKEIIQKYGDLIQDTSTKEKLTEFADYQSSFSAKVRLLCEHDLGKYTDEPLWQLRLKIMLNLF